MNPAEVRRPSKRSRLRAAELLTRAIRLRRDFAAAHALLAYVLLELDDLEGALSPLRRAVKLCPSDETYQDFLLETLDRTGRHRELQKQLATIAKLRRVDLASLRGELRAAGFPANPSTLRQNAFPGGERHFVSGLFDVAEAIEREYAADRTNNLERPGVARQAVTIDARRVPAELRPVVRLARKWGIPDDADRGSLVSRASPDERTEMRKILSPRMRRRICEWIDSFPDASSMTKEASHFMYLLEAYDEM